jgi:LysM repeat protein
MQGETFASISRKHRIALDALLAANPEVKPTQLKPGQTIRLAGGPASGPVKTPTIRETPVASATPTAPKPVAMPRGMGSASTSTMVSTHATPVAKSPPAADATSSAGEVVTAEATPTAQPAAAAPAIAATEPKVNSAPQPAPATAPIETIESSPAPNTEKKIRSVTIEGEMTYGEFAAKHGTDPDRLNDLNGLDLTHATVLAKGSELYVPAQP